MPTGPMIILTLKILVAAVTVLFAGSLVALAAGRPRLHGRINTVFFALTMATVAGFEALIITLGRDHVTSHFNDAQLRWLRVHLWFAVPSAVLLPAMFITGRARRKRLHIAIGCAFTLLWLGTFITGVFFLPHE